MESSAAVEELRTVRGRLARHLGELCGNQAVDPWRRLAYHEHLEYSESRGLAERAIRRSLQAIGREGAFALCVQLLRAFLPRFLESHPRNRSYTRMLSAIERAAHRGEVSVRPPQLRWYHTPGASAFRFHILELYSAATGVHPQALWDDLTRVVLGSAGIWAQYVWGQRWRMDHPDLPPPTFILFTVRGQRIGRTLAAEQWQHAQTFMNHRPSLCMGLMKTDEALGLLETELALRAKEGSL